MDQAYDFNDMSAVCAALLEPLSGDDVSKREGPGGKKLAYLKGGQAIVNANEIFGPLGWDFVLQVAEVLHVHEETRETYDDRAGKQVTRTYYQAIATARGFARHKATGAERADVGVDNSEALPYRYMAINAALKGAATDCMKRSLRSFGFRLGLALYFSESEREAEGYVTAATPQAPKATGAGAAPPAAAAAPAKGAKDLVARLRAGPADYQLTQAELGVLSGAATAAGVSAKVTWIAAGAAPPALPRAAVALAFVAAVEDAAKKQAAPAHPATDPAVADIAKASEAGVPMTEIAASAAKASAVAAPLPPTTPAQSASPASSEPAIPPIATPATTTPSSPPAAPAAEKPKRTRAKKETAPSADAATATAAPSATPPSAPTPTPPAAPPAAAASAPPPAAPARPGLFSVAFLDRVTSMPADQKIPQEAMREIGQVAKQNGLDPSVVAKEKGLEPAKGLTGAQAVVLVKALAASFFDRTSNATGLPPQLQEGENGKKVADRLGKYFVRQGPPANGQALAPALLGAVVKEWSKLRAGDAAARQESVALVESLRDQGFALDDALVKADFPA